MGLSGAVWGGIDYVGVHGAVLVASGGTSAPITMQGLLQNAAFGGAFGGVGFYANKLFSFHGMTDDVGQFVGNTVSGAVYSASRARLKIPNRFVKETVDDNIERSLKMFKKAGGTINRNAGPAPIKVIKGEKFRVLGRMNAKKKTIELFDGHEIQDVVEELAHFRQAKRDGVWGKMIPDKLGKLWENQIDNILKNLGFIK